MIAWLLWCVLVLHLFILEGAVAMWALPACDLSVALCLYMALFARTGAVPGLLISSALARAVFVPGSAAVHVLALGIPVAVLLPLRGVLSRRFYMWQCAVTGFLAATQPGLLNLLGRVTGQDIPAEPLAASRLFWAMLVMPPLVFLLRSLPPLSRFQERSE